MTITYYCTTKLNFYKAKILLRLLLGSLVNKTSVKISKVSTYTEACVKHSVKVRPETMDFILLFKMALMVMSN